VRVISHSVFLFLHSDYIDNVVSSSVKPKQVWTYPGFRGA